MPVTTRIDWVDNGVNSHNEVVFLDAGVEVLRMSLDEFVQLEAVTYAAALSAEAPAPEPGAEARQH